MTVNIDKVSNEVIQDKFEEAFEEQVAKLNNISEFEATCLRGANLPDTKMEVMICGFAGTPTLSDYKEGKVENSESVNVEIEGKGFLSFELLPVETIALNTNDYNVVYRLCE